MWFYAVGQSSQIASYAVYPVFVQDMITVYVYYNRNSSGCIQTRRRIVSLVRRIGEKIEDIFGQGMFSLLLENSLGKGSGGGTEPLTRIPVLVIMAKIKTKEERSSARVQDYGIFDR